MPPEVSHDSLSSKNSTHKYPPLPVLTDEARANALVTSELGSDILGDNAVLVRMPSLEGRKFLIPVDDIRRNPNQPRKDFKEDKLQELADGISESGQQEAIKVIPFSDGNKIKLFLVDGERRHRALYLAGMEYAVGEVIWEADEDKIFEISFILNVQREGHTPMEIAWAIDRMIKNTIKKQGVDKKEAINIVSKKTGYKIPKIKLYLEYLTFDDSVQDMIHEGRLKESYILEMARGADVEGRSSANTRRENVNMAVKRLLELEGRRMESAQARSIVPLDQSGGKFSRFDMQKAAADVRRSKMTPEELRQEEVERALAKTRSAIDTLLKQIPLLTVSGDRTIVLAKLRKMGQGVPPEVLRDGLEKLFTETMALLDVTEEAIKPPPLVIPLDKPSFADHIKECSKDIDPKRVDILQALARASDDGGRVVTSAELAKTLGISSGIVASNIQVLRNELIDLELEIDMHSVRTKDVDNNYDKVIAYRLAWVIKKEDTEDPRKNQGDADSGVDTAGDGLNIKITASEDLDEAAQAIADILFSKCKSQIKSAGLKGSGNDVILHVTRKKDKDNTFIVSSNISNFPLNFAMWQKAFTQIIRDKLRLPSGVRVFFQQIFSN
jgi:ParB/RepB/Spo0J family partition protein